MLTQRTSCADAVQRTRPLRVRSASAGSRSHLPSQRLPHAQPVHAQKRFESLTPRKDQRLPAANVLPNPLSSLFTAPEPQPAARIEGSFKASGKTVVITGGSQGIGRATALLFARNGWNVVVAARNPEKLQYVAQDCAEVAGRQGASLGVVCDVTDERQVRNLANTVLAKFENVDVLVNNAGILARGSFTDTPAAEAEKLLQTNYMGAYHVTQAFVPIMMHHSQKTRPSIIMVNSFAGKVPMKNMAAFTASKYALMGFTEAIRAELEPHNIHVGQVYPGVVKSSHMERAAFYGKNEAEERRLWRQNVKLLPISQTPQQVAEAIFNAATTKRNDVVVGLPYAAVDIAYKATGINPMAMPLAFMP